MPEPLDLEMHRPPSGLRIAFALIGLPLALVGLLAAYRCLGAIFLLLGGGQIEGSLALGVVIAVGFTGIGGALVWAFFIPEKKLRLDPGRGSAELTLRYPFGITRLRHYQRSALRPPEVVWVSDSDKVTGGYWRLDLVLPDGQRLERRALIGSDADQRAALERLRDEIAALIDPVS